MFKTTLKTTFRNMRKQKAFSFINIFGLAVGIACCALALLWVQHEISYDKFHQNADRIYRLLFTNAKHDDYSQSVPGGLADYLKNTYPEIIGATITGSRNINLNHGDKGFFCQGFFVHSSFFEMFTFPFAQGDPTTAFTHPISIVLSENLAQKLFGDQDPLGKMVKVENATPIKVTGVLKKIPDNSTIQFDFLLSYRIAPSNMKGFDVWNPNVYVLLQENSSVDELNDKIAGIHAVHNPKATHVVACLSPFSETHLREFTGGGLITYIYIFSALALFILLIACFNFMNLSTARYETRSREIGVKKVVGSTRSQLIFQFLFESVISSVAALFCAVILIVILLPIVNNILGFQLALHYSYIYIFGIAAITLTAGLFAGAYPALYLSAFRPVDILKGSTFPDKKYKASLFRKMLVVAQFTISVGFIICAIMIFKQLDYIRNKDLGFDKDCVIRVSMQGNLRRQSQVLKRELFKDPGVEYASVTANKFIGWWSSSSVSWEGKKSDKHVILGYNWVDYDYLDTFKTELVAGRFFSREIRTDAQDAFVINETAVRAMGLTDPLGKEIVRSPGSPYEDSGKVIGVVKDYHSESLHGEIRPFCLMLATRGANMNIRIAADNISQTIDHIGKAITKIAPGHPFVYSFLDEEIESLYRTDRLVGELIPLITLVAIIISCLGLFGLAAFSVERRTKEIGIRKILGASIPNIVKLMSTEFLVLVLTANIVSWPVSWYIMNRWLQNFSYRTSIEIWIFFGAGLIALSIAFLTVFHQTAKLAVKNPVDSLRYE
jgi:putative ABC transport system permease protein